MDVKDPTAQAQLPMTVRTPDSRCLLGLGSLLEAPSRTGRVTRGSSGVKTGWPPRHAGLTAGAVRAPLFASPETAGRRHSAAAEQIMEVADRAGAGLARSM